MSFTPAPWVHYRVKEICATLENSTSPYSEAERSRWQRLASDDRMRPIYQSKTLPWRISPDAWHYWFEIARGIGDIAASRGFGQGSALKEERDRLKRYADLMHTLNSQLSDVVDTIKQIDEMDLAESNHPLEMTYLIPLIEASVAIGGSDIRHDFEHRVLPKLNQIKQDGSKFIPNVPLVLNALHDVVNDACRTLDRCGPQASDSAIAQALKTRQHSPLTEYVRAFDERMREYAFCFGDDFLMPVDLMVIQAEVALGQCSVDAKSIKSARS